MHVVYTRACVRACVFIETIRRESPVSNAHLRAATPSELLPWSVWGEMEDEEEPFEAVRRHWEGQWLARSAPVPSRCVLSTDARCACCPLPLGPRADAQFRKGAPGVRPVGRAVRRGQALVLLRLDTVSGNTDGFLFRDADSGL